MNESDAAFVAQEKFELSRHLNGTSVWVIYSFSHMFSVTIPMRGLIVALLSRCFVLSSFQIFHIDFFVLIFPNLLFVTVLYEYHSYTFVATLLIFLMLCFLYQTQTSAMAASKREQQKPKNHNKLPVSFISFDDCPVVISIFHSRAMLNVITTICILAVDFNSYSTDLAKSECYGTGLMDVGVGSFAFLNGLVAQRPPKPSSQHQPSPPVNRGIWVKLKTSSFHSLCLFIIGVCRMIFVEILGYHKNVSEYGVHWNFFITLSVLNIISSIVLNIFSFRVVFVTSLLFLFSNQYFLINGLANFIQNENTRSNFISANIEGFVSLPGFLALNVLGNFFGIYMYYRTSTLKLAEKLFVSFVVVVFCWMASAFCGYWIEPVWRSTANVAYSLWIVSYNVHIIFSVFLNYIIFYLISRVLGSPIVEQCELNLLFGKCDKCSVNNVEGYCVCIFSAIYRNQLWFFLLANLLTGAVNLSMDTEAVSTWLSVLICAVYMYFLCLVFVLKEFILHSSYSSAGKKLKQKLE